MSSGIARALEQGVENDLRPALADAGKALENAVRSVAHGAEGVAERTEANEADVLGKITAIGGKDASGALGGAERDAGNLAGREAGAARGAGEEPNLRGDGEGGGSREGEGNEGAHTEGDPVDVVSGQMISTVVDVQLAGLLPLVLRRAYASGYRGGRRFGPGWSSTLDQRLEIDADGIHYAGDDAQILHYPIPDPARPGHTVLPEGGARWPLSWDRESDTIRIADARSGWTRHFAPVGVTRAGGSEIRPLTALSDRNGHRITFVCDDEDIATDVQHSGGYRIAVDTGHTAAGFRIEALRLLDGDAGGQGTTLLTYQYDPRGRLVGVVNSSGLPFVYEYDEQDRIVAAVDRTGSRYEYVYDDAGRVVRGIGDEGYLSAEFAYDTQRRVTTVTNSLGHATEYHYDAHEHITTTVDALGNATLTEYDRYGRLTAITDPLGNTTRYTLDEHGNPLRIEQSDGAVISAAYNDAGQLTRLAGAAGTTWTYAYDERGNLLTVTDPLDAATAYTYDERGRLTSVTDPTGNTTTIETNPAGLQSAFTDPLGHASRIERDGFGRPVAITDPLGNTTRFGWRIEGEALWRRLPDGTREEWEYDGEGNQTLHRNPAGLETRYEYGPFSLRALEVRPDGARYAFAYNTERDLVAVTNPLDLTWRYEYDACGRIVRETDFNGRTTAREFDAAGRLVARVNGAGQRATLIRDTLGRVTERHLDQGSSTVYTYDPEGRLRRAASGGSVLEYAYDAAGRLTAETVDGRTVASGYDAAGRRVQRTTASGLTSHWAFDGNGNPAGLAGAGGALSFQYDPVGQETARFLGPGAALTQTFDPAYRLASQGVWAYDAPATESGTQWPDSAPGGYRPLAQRTYAYRPDGYPTAVTDTLRGDRRHELDPAGRITAVDGDAWSEHYAYDRAGDLVTGAWPGADDDAQGEREYQGTSVRRAGRVHYEYDAQGRVTRTTRRTLSGQARTLIYTWDADDRLTSVTTPDGATWQYTYDPLGRRTTKQRLSPDGGVTHWTGFVWDGRHLAEQTRILPDGHTETITWDWEPGTDRVAAQTHSVSALSAPQEEIDRRFYAIVADTVGTPTELVDPTGRIAWTARTTVWGRQTANDAREPISDTAATLTCPLGFPGQYRDDETGLHYNYLRYYDPDTARYLSPDPLGLFPSPDDYAYVANPLLSFDPLGLAPHHARITVFDPAGNVRYQYGLVSGHTLPEEAALGFPNAMMATHTENRSMRMHGASPTVPIPNDPYAGTHPVQPGDHVVIDGEKPPCPQCKGAMNRAVNELGVNVTYNWGGNVWHATG